MEELKVPLIDIAPILKGADRASEELKKVIGEISRACETCGFFYIKNHGVSKTLITSAVENGLAFFRLPKEDKNSVARFEGNFQGYSDSELTKQKVDWKQIFDFSAENYTPSAGEISGVHGHNQWPNAPSTPSFKTTMTAYFQAMRNLALLLMKCIFAGLSEKNSLEEADLFIGSCFSLEGEGDTSFARLNYYPEYSSEGSQGTEEDQLGVGPHSDAGVLTILYQQEGVTSLQIQKDGAFYNVPPIEDTFVINIGDMTQVWSNEKYQAPVHRVLTNPTESRFSIPFFLNPKYSCVVQPLVEQGKKYRPILWGEYRRGRVLGDYADIGEELQISHYLVNQ